MSFILNDDYDTYFTRLNSLRANFNLTAKTVPDTPSKQTLIPADYNNILNTYVSDTYTELKNGHIRNLPSFVSFAVSNGTLIKKETTLDIANVNFDGITDLCVDRANNTSDYSDNSNDRHNGDNSVGDQYYNNNINYDNNSEGCGSHGGPSNYYDGGDFST